MDHQVTAWRVAMALSLAFLASMLVLWWVTETPAPPVNRPIPPTTVNVVLYP